MKILISILLSISLFLVTSPVQAHFGGVPVIKINNKQTDIYTSEEAASIGDYYIPSDIGPDNYLVNKQITFQADKDRLPFPEEVIKTASYEWDFGDGKKAKGEKVKHTYTKMGSYQVTLVINFPKEEETPPEDINPNSEMFGFTPVSDQQQFVLIHVLPNKDYQVPKIVTKIDGKEIRGPKERIELSFFHNFGSFSIPKSISFDASKSLGTGKIKEYYWSFDFENTSKKAKTSYGFKEDYFAYNTGVRIMDENGFYSAAFFTLYNPSKLDYKEGEEKIIIPRIVSYAAGLVVIGLIGGSIFYIKNRVKKKGKNSEE
jgi:hypothetical protein